MIFGDVLGKNYIYVLSEDAEREHYPRFGPSRRMPKSGEVQPIESNPRDSTKKLTGRTTALVRVCRQIYFEATPLVYSLNTFRTDDTDLLLRRMEYQHRLDSVHAIQISDEVNEDWWIKNFSRSRPLKVMFPNLKQFVIREETFEFFKEWDFMVHKGNCVCESCAERNVYRYIGSAICDGVEVLIDYSEGRLERWL
jgi:hypothetical protein